MEDQEWDAQVTRIVGVYSKVRAKLPKDVGEAVALLTLAVIVAEGLDLVAASMPASPSD